MLTRHEAGQATYLNLLLRNYLTPSVREIPLSHPPAWACRLAFRAGWSAIVPVGHCSADVVPILQGELFDQGGELRLVDQVRTMRTCTPQTA